MKLISWNVAGFRAVLKKGFDDFFKEIDADIFSMQESKVTSEQFSYEPEGYHQYLFPAVRKGYSGTLIYSKEEALSVRYGFGEDEYDDEGRVITLEYDKFYLVNVYVPNVKRELERMESRMYFEDKFREYLCQLDKIKPVIICGDFNVAHEEIDIKNVKANIGHAGFTYEERGKMIELLEIGFVDTFRYYNKDVQAFSWWSYMGKAREKDVGWRIDYFLVSERIIGNVNETKIYKDVMGSDHCPIGISITM